MLFWLPLLFQAGSAPSASRPFPVPRAGDEGIGRVPDTALCVRLEIPGFTADDRDAKILQKVLGPRAIIVGAIPDRLIRIEVVADKETAKHVTDSEWRDMNLRDSGGAWKYFDAPGMLAGEISVLMEGSGSHDFHAFTVRGGFRFDVHEAESLSDMRKATIPRSKFLELVGTFRLGLVRLGTWSQMPPAVLDLMDQALRKPNDWKSYFDEMARTSPQDYTVPFAEAEVSRFEGGAPMEQIEAYSKAIEQLAAKKELTAQERLAHAASEDELALAWLEQGDGEKALPHLEFALKIAGNLTAPIRAAILYDMALAEARLGHAELALSRLEEAESSEAGAVLRSKTDKGFEAVRRSKGFQELMHGGRTKR